MRMRIEVVGIPRAIWGIQPVEILGHLRLGHGSHDMFFFFLICLLLLLFFLGSSAIVVYALYKVVITSTLMVLMALSF